jgi:hypothetical protein
MPSSSAVPTTLPERIAISLVAVAAAALALCYGTAQNTVGVAALAGIGGAAGCLVVGPLLWRVLARSADHLRLGRFRVWQYRILAAAATGVLAAACLVEVNGARLSTRPYHRDVTVLTAGTLHRVGRPPEFYVRVSAPGFGPRRLVLAASAWGQLPPGSELMLFLRPGRLGRPVIFGFHLTTPEFPAPPEAPPAPAPAHGAAPVGA